MNPPLPSAPPPPPRRRAFAAFAWLTLAYTLLVILWGAYVRAAGAGNGCGDNWPLCDGQFLPAHPQLKMLIEFLHRVSSGVDGVLILVLLLGALWLYPRRHAVRRSSAFAAAFLVAEALLGAALVLFGWVGSNLSAARLAADSLHLANTLLLLAAVALTAAFASGFPTPPLRGRRAGSGWLAAALAAVLVTGICGTMAALADTLFPSRSLAAGLRQDFSSSAALLDRLRVIHPIVAIAAGLFLIWLVVDRLPAARTVLARRLGLAVVAAVLLQWACGALDVLLLAPVPMQMLHLFTADLLWLLLVLFAAARLASPAVATDAADTIPTSTARSPIPSPGTVGASPARRTQS